jgi:hypothetical protein
MVWDSGPLSLTEKRPHIGLCFVSALSAKTCSFLSSCSASSSDSSLSSSAIHENDDRYTSATKLQQPDSAPAHFIHSFHYMSRYLFIYFSIFFIYIKYQHITCYPLTCYRDRLMVTNIRFYYAHPRPK